MTSIYSQGSVETLLAGKLTVASNLSDLADASTARTNLGLGGLAVINDAPSDGSQYARQDGAWSVVTGGGGGGGGVDIQVFGSPTTSGTFTWTKPAGAKWVEFYLVASGGTGGSGARNAVGSIRGGGAGGGAGSAYVGRVHADSLGATETVTVGAGMTGTAGVTVNATAGFSGTAGLPTLFSAFRAQGGGAGSGGSLTGAIGGGSSPTGYFYHAAMTGMPGGNGQISGTGGQAPAINFSYLMPTGGGGGCGVTSAVAGRGGNGGTFLGTSNSGVTLTIAGGTGATALGVVATNGTNMTNRLFQGGTGGGGGAYRPAMTGAWANGANGGWPGGGSGGGAGVDNGYTSGASGNSANGLAVITTYF
jgi:hypothetical protein